MVTTVVNTWGEGYGYELNDGTGYQQYWSSELLASGKKFYLRFALPIYPGSTINSATLTSYFYQKTATDAATEYLSFRAHKVANSPALVPGVVEYNRPQTTANVSHTINWNTAGASDQAYTTPSLKSIFQEIIAQAGYARANKMTLIATVTQEGSALSWRGPTGSTGATLTIDWTPPAGIVLAPPTCNIVSHTAPERWGRSNLTIQYNDISPDPMTKYQLRWREVSTTSWSTGSEVSQSAQAGQQFIASTNILPNPGPYEFQARVYDGGEWSEWAPSTPYNIVVNDIPDKPTNLANTSIVPGNPINIGYTYVDTEGDPQEEFYIKWRPVL